jgi:hypothetical protein
MTVQLSAVLSKASRALSERKARADLQLGVRQHGMRQQAIADRAQHMPLLAPAGQQPGKLRLPDAANPLGIQPTQRRPSRKKSPTYPYSPKIGKLT